MHPKMYKSGPCKPFDILKITEMYLATHINFHSTYYTKLYKYIELMGSGVSACTINCWNRSKYVRIIFRKIKLISLVKF
jgi:hypothetical protein